MTVLGWVLQSIKMLEPHSANITSPKGTSHPTRCQVQIEYNTLPLSINRARSASLYTTIVYRQGAIHLAIHNHCPSTGRAPLRYTQPLPIDRARYTTLSPWTVNFAWIGELLLCAAHYAPPIVHGYARKVTKLAVGLFWMASTISRKLDNFFSQHQLTDYYFAICFSL